MPSKRTVVTLGVLFGLMVLISLACLAVLILTNPTRLNPLEAFILRVKLTQAQDILMRVPSGNGTPVCFNIEQGANAKTIAASLKAEGFITDDAVFSDYLRYYSLDSQLRASKFSLQRNLTMPQVAALLTSDKDQSVPIRVIEGWRIEQIAASIDQTAGLTFRGADFLALVGAGTVRQPFIQEFATKNNIPAGRSLEGFLYPATYRNLPCEPLTLLVQEMLTAFDTRVTDALRSEAAASGLNMYQVVTLASIVEREVIVDEERPIVASVYLNRYRNSISSQPTANVPRTLDADPTIQYALANTRDPSTWWPRITQADYRGVSSPYNTYLNVGLPPGPIANPRLSSIEGVIHPAVTDYVYFQAMCSGNGRHNFARTFEEHLSNSCN